MQKAFFFGFTGTPIDKTTLNFSDYSCPASVYSDIGIYKFKNSNHKQAIEYKIKEE